jgi:hypothetical protein
MVMETVYKHEAGSTSVQCCLIDGFVLLGVSILYSACVHSIVIL